MSAHEIPPALKRMWRAAGLLCGWLLICSWPAYVPHSLPVPVSLVLIALATSLLTLRGPGDRPRT